MSEINSYDEMQREPIVLTTEGALRVACIKAEATLKTILNKCPCGHLGQQIDWCPGCIAREGLREYRKWFIPVHPVVQ